jgi:hypothetical protein
MCRGFGREWRTHTASQNDVAAAAAAVLGAGPQTHLPGGVLILVAALSPRSGTGAVHGRLEREVTTAVHA